MPTLRNHVRRAVDDRALPGQFILTGSTTPADDITRHAGTGRLSRLRMRTMRCFETGHSTGLVSVQALFGGEPVRTPETALTVPDIATRVAVGGWPGHLRLPDRDAVRVASDNLRELHRSEIERLDEDRRDPRRVAALVRAIARHVAAPAPTAALVRDAAGPEGHLDRDTVARYMDALDRLMITEDQPAWTPHLRSRSRARTAPKRHFVDPSLAAAALGATPPRSLRDVETLGLLFESLVITATGYGYDRPDGVAVVPIGALGP